MNKKTQKMTLLMTTMLLLTSICFTQSIAAITAPCSIKGVLYINDEIAPEGIVIKLNFTTGTNSTTTYVFNDTGDNTNYNLGFWDHEGETGQFIVEYNGEEIIPEDNQSIYIENGVPGYIMDLHIIVEIPENHPPEKPVDPDPANNSINVSINPELSVNVSDPDDDAMDVSFFDASDDSLIGTAEDVANGSTASVTWPDLEHNTTYSWYAVANDSEFENKSDTWSFKTEKEDEPDEIDIQIRVKMLGFGRICATVKNNGETNLTDVEYKINMTAGILKRVKVSNNCTFKNFSAGSTKKICTGKMFLKGSVRPLCFGKASGFVEIKVDGQTFTKEFSGRVISKLVIILRQDMVEE